MKIRKQPFACACCLCKELRSDISSVRKKGNVSRCLGQTALHFVMLLVFTKVLFSLLLNWLAASPLFCCPNTAPAPEFPQDTVGLIPSLGLDWMWPSQVPTWRALALHLQPSLQRKLSASALFGSLTCLGCTSGLQGTARCGLVAMTLEEGESAAAFMGKIWPRIYSAGVRVSFLWLHLQPLPFSLSPVCLSPAPSFPFVCSCCLWRMQTYSCQL